jgi:fatty-acid O-methyltransferase
VDRVRWFFETYVPERLQAGPAGLDGRFAFDVTDHGRWVIDFGHDPPAVAPGEDGDCALELTAEDLLAMVDDPFSGQVRAWQGRLRATGDQALLRRAADVLFPLPAGDNGAYAGYYAALARLIPDPRLTFMNHGYDGEPAPALDADEQPWQYSVGLVRRALRGARVEGARVLDVGCGRGGAAAYIARHLGAAEVVGLDASQDAIDFCTRRHAHANLRFVHGHADDLPFEDAAFDVVLNVESSHCYLDRAAFFAEVGRVLAPGGSFAYADIFQGTELADTRALLAAQPDLEVLGVEDITDGVARAIDLNRSALSALLTSTIDPALGNAAIVGDLIASVNGAIYRNYRSGRWTYQAWRVEKDVKT